MSRVGRHSRQSADSISSSFQKPFQGGQSQLRLLSMKSTSNRKAHEILALACSVLFFVGAIISLVTLSFGLYVALGLTLAGIFSMLIYSNIRNPSDSSTERGIGHEKTRVIVLSREKEEAFT
jgi:hypothetical protein